MAARSVAASKRDGPRSMIDASFGGGAVGD
jgi:hypothetical protein